MKRRFNSDDGLPFRNTLTLIWVGECNFTPPISFLLITQKRQKL